MSADPAASDEPDERSVGKLLHEADRTGRQLLFDATGHDAAALLRTWGEVVDAAADLWRAFPQSPLADDPGLSVVDRLQELATRLHRVQLGWGWPGEGAADERLLRMAETFTRAAELVHRYGNETRPTSGAAWADLAAARMLTMHGLYVTSHAIGVAVREHRTTLQHDHAGSHGPDTVARSTQTLARLATFEQTAAAYVGGHFAATAAGEVDPRPDGRRLREALTHWDTQAHRSLTASPTPANLQLATRMQAMVATATAAITHAGVATGAVQSHQYDDRLAPALDVSQQAWNGAARGWQRLNTPSGRPDADLARAGNELCAALREITDDKTAWAPPQLMGARVDLAAAAGDLQQALVGAVELAGLTREIAAEHRLTGPAQAVARLLDDIAPPGDGHVSRLGAAVSVADIHANRTIALPHPARHHHTNHADRAAAAATHAASAAAWLGPANRYQAAPTVSASPRSRRLQPHEPAPSPAPEPHVACER